MAWWGAVDWVTQNTGESERVQYNSKDGTLVVNHVDNPPGDMAVYTLAEMGICGDHKSRREKAKMIMRYGGSVKALQPPEPFIKREYTTDAGVMCQVFTEAELKHFCYRARHHLIEDKQFGFKSDAKGPMELASWLANMQRFDNACLWCNIDGESEFIEDWDIPICKDCCSV